MTEQPNWAWCSQCQSIWYAGRVASSVCPLPSTHPDGFPSQHAFAGSNNYNLTYGIAPQDFHEAPGAQGGWAWCERCGCLWFTGNGKVGHCAGGGGHSKAGSGAYLVAEAAGAKSGWQHDWRYCDKCLVLWFSGNGVGLCPAGGGHSQAASGQNYIVKELGGQPSIGGLDHWLRAYPVVGASIVWEDKNGAHPWPTWTAQHQQELEQAYALACAGSSIPVAEIPKNQLHLSDTDNAEETLSTADAWAYFKASVAQSLALETRVQLPWSIIGFNEEVPYSEAKLAQLFDSRTMFRWSASPAGYSISGSTSGWLTPAPPAYTYKLLQTAGLIGASRLDTVANIIGWCHQKLSHFTGGMDIANVVSVWQYRGLPPMVRVIKGTTSTSTSLGGGSEFARWTAGCWGTTGLLIAIGRAVNIPVELVTHAGHAQPHFMADAKYLSHGDDCYNTFTWATPPVPPKEILISKATFDSWFGSGVPATQVANNIGRRSLDIGIEYLPNTLLRDYCADQTANTSKAHGKVAAEFAPTYTVAELEAQNLWSRMDTKLTSLGGCSHVPWP
jgi:hypothetical protein